MTRFNRVRVDALLFNEEIEKVFECIQAPIDRGRSQFLAMLLLNKPIDLTK